jgi:lipopolysaccharide export system protein LptA
MLINKILCLLIATLLGTAHAASINDLTSGITDALNISAENLEIDNLKGVAIYTGDVNVDLGKRILRCDKLEVYRGTGSDIGRIIAYGDPVGYEGHVSDNPEIIHAYSDMMEYDLEKQIFYMRGNARVEQGKNIYEAPEIQYDVENEIITSSPSSKGRIHMVIDAESLNGL